MEEVKKKTIDSFESVFTLKTEQITLTDLLATLSSFAPSADPLVPPPPPLIYPPCWTRVRQIARTICRGPNQCSNCPSSCEGLITGGQGHPRLERAESTIRRGG